MNDKRLFAETLTGIAEIYGQTVTKAGMRIWWAALERFSDEQVQQALNAHATDAERGQWMPKPADIVRRIEGTPDDAAVAAWTKVEHALRRIGGGPSWVFDDPKIHRALQQIGGVSALSNCPSEKDLTFLREQFCKRYASPQNAGSYPAKLVGWHSDGKPVLIGDQAKCQQVLEGGGNDQPALTDAGVAAQKVLTHMAGQA
jgi:hypothetical protein